ncbi:hypothetical protein [Methylobacterium platani]|uniref:hypothetical protein n=1 Tax=Methylobacterium platani TaxID=427683 RepID=UPI001428924F|nr:hypothetical protein [Methylobacterium platani]
MKRSPAAIAASSAATCAASRASPAAVTRGKARRSNAGDRPERRLDQVAVADPCSKVFAAQFDRRFPANGDYVRQRRRGKEYFYCKGYERAVDGVPGRHILIYVGRVDDSEVQRCVESFGRTKELYRTRRELGI